MLGEYFHITDYKVIHNMIDSESQLLWFIHYPDANYYEHIIYTHTQSVMYSHTQVTCIYAYIGPMAVPSIVVSMRVLVGAAW